MSIETRMADNAVSEVSKVITEEIRLTKLSEIQEQKIEWLFNGRVPKGELTIFAGTGGAGKSSLMCDILSGLSSGRATLFDQASKTPFDESRDPQKTLVFTTEDDFSKALVPRLKGFEADTDNILTITPDDERFKDISFNSELLKKILDQHRPSLCIFDPLESFIPDTVNMSQRNQMRHCLNALVEYAHKFGTTIIIIVHCNKRQGVSGAQRIADSQDIWDIARSVFLFGYTDEADIRYISHEKSSYGVLAKTILYQIDDNGFIHFKGLSALRDADYIRKNNYSKSAPKRDEAEEIILNELDDADDGKMAIAELDAILKSNGISDKTVKNAKADLIKLGCIVKSSVGFGKDKKYYYTRSSVASEKGGYSKE